MMREPDPNFSFDADPDQSADHLTPMDAQALDALIDAGFDLAMVAPEFQDRAHRVSILLKLVDDSSPETVASRDGLIGSTLQAIERHRQQPRAVPDRHYALSPSDEDAFEALVGAGFTSAHTPSPIRRRATRQAGILELLRPADAEISGREDRIASTLDRVQKSIESHERSLVFEAPVARGRRFRIADLVSIAALLLIGTAVFGPMLGAARERARQTACAAGLQTAGLGFGMYAGDERDALPLATASTVGNPWWHVGKAEQSNSANLYTLSRTGYVKVDSLACDGNKTACRRELGPDARDWTCLSEVSYSYQNQFAPPERRAKWNSSVQIVVAVDASPVVRRAVQKQWINPLANSMNHGGRGQNALFNDGRVQWLTTPVLESGDNIWLPQALEQFINKLHRPTHADPIQGTESPGSAEDVFVAP